MDQFLPGDISVMVLKFLASSGCESTVVTMIEEMPVLKFYVPKQQPGVSKADFVRMLGRPSLTPSLNDILNDYGQAKNLVTEMVEKEKLSDSPLRHCDSLLTQLKLLSNVLSNMTKELSMKVPTPKPAIAIEEKAVNTDNIDPPVICPPVVKVGVHVETQTTELPIIDFGASAGEATDVPMMFYNSLMSHPQKLAMTINEHFDTSRPRDEVLQKVCSTAENEIDNFFVNLLHDEGPSGMDIETFPTLSNLMSEKPNEPNSQSHVFIEVERNLSNLFGDAQSVITADPLALTIESQHSAPQVGTSNQIRSNANSSNDTNAKGNANKVTPPPPTPDTSSNDTNTMGHTQNPRIPKKRITPTPAKPEAVINPVFEKVKIVEPVTSPEGPNYSIHTVKTVPLVSDWQKLGRRPIMPKIPSPITPLDPTPVKTSTEKHVSFKNKVSENKRKAKMTTPVKLTPEKAKSIDVNFILVCHDTPKVGSSGASSTTKSNNQHNVQLECSSAIKPEVQKEDVSTTGTELSINQTPAEKVEQAHISLTNSGVEVTPCLDIPNFNTQSSVPETTGPKVSRLATSEQKFSVCSTQLNIVRKSYSSPRKKKHVRSLFNTPPSIKNHCDSESPCSPSQVKTTNDHGVALVLPVKRKRTVEDDCQPQNKKRLEWVEENAKKVYNSSAFPDRSFHSTRMKESMKLSATKVLKTKTTENGTAQKSEPGKGTSNVKKPGGVKISVLPKIPEEIPSTATNTSIPKDSALQDKSLNLDVTPDPDSKPLDSSQRLLVPPDLPALPHHITSSPPKSDPPILSKLPTSNQEISPKEDNSFNKSSSLMKDLFGSDESSEGNTTLPEKKGKQRTSTRNNSRKKSPKPSSSSRPPREKRAPKNAPAPKPAVPKQLTPPPAVPTKASKKEISPPSILVTPPEGEKPSKKLPRKSPRISPRKSPRKTPNKPANASPRPKRGRRSLRELDAAAANSVVSDAVALGRDNHKKTSPKNVPTIHMTAPVTPLLPTKILSSERVFRETLIAPFKVTAPEQATPMKEPIAFNILPPFSFPDPTPTKGPTIPPAKGFTSSPLVTPMKDHSSTSTSPPMPLPPTPRYLVNEPDADSSNSLGMFKMTEGLYSNSSFMNGFTPSKFLVPPPTPGRTLFLDENSRAYSIEYSQPKKLESEEEKKLNVPLDKPIPVSTEQPSGSREKVEKLTPPTTKLVSPAASLAQKLAQWKAKSQKAAATTRDGDFQVPQEPPKRTSPATLNANAKKTSVEKNAEKPVVSNKPFIFPNIPNILNTGVTQSNIIKPEAGDIAPSSSKMKFVVEGTTKVLSMSEHQTLLGLLEMGNGRVDNLKSNFKSSTIKNEVQSQGRGLLKNVNLNSFLQNVHRMSEPKNPSNPSTHKT